MIHLLRTTRCLESRFADKIRLGEARQTWKDIHHGSEQAGYEPDPDVPDELVFRSSRSIRPLSFGTALLKFAKKPFVQWAAGSRACAGHKRAEIEFVAVVVTLLRSCKLEKLPSSSEHPRDVLDQLDRRLDDGIWETVLQVEGVIREGCAVETTQKRCDGREKPQICGRIDKAIDHVTDARL
jgi:hypothetical protein